MLGQKVMVFDPETLSDAEIDQWRIELSQERARRETIRAYPNLADYHLGQLQDAVGFEREQHAAWVEPDLTRLETLYRLGDIVTTSDGKTWQSLVPNNMCDPTLGRAGAWKQKGEEQA